MSHQSGIHASNSVVTELTGAHQDNTRAMCIVILNEELTVTDRYLINSNWKQDYDTTVVPLLHFSRPCYVLFKLDSKSSFGPDWVLISWMPDASSVRDKMLYASTRATLRKQFGDHLIKHDINGSVINDVDLNGFEKYLVSKSAPAPLTETEELLIARSNIEDASGLFIRRQTGGSLMFQLTPEAVKAVERFCQNELDYVQLAIDIDQELISCSVTMRSLEAESLIKYTPTNEGRYHLYRFLHHHEGQNRIAVLFIHSICGYQGSAKNRMLYSSCKSGLMSSLEHDFHLQFQLRLETDNMTEIDANYLLESLYPKPVEQKLKFAKPTGPAGRRPRKKFT